MKVLGCSVLLILWACCGAEDGHQPITQGDIDRFEDPHATEINCPVPAIPHGTITNGKPVFRKDERLEFYCEMGYKYESRTPECTEEGWNPKPVCKEIECYYQTVVNGEMLPKRDKYKQDDTVDLNCHSGFVALYSKDRKPTCTKDGWVPPLKCESKACDYPEIENGRVSSWSYRYYRNHYFPMEKGREIDYECDRGYATESGYGSGRIRCTDEGWTPAPRCRRTCERPHFDNMDMFFKKPRYTEGQTVSFRCYTGFFTHEGQEAGTVECLSNGQFSQATCIQEGSNCGPAPPLLNGDIEGSFKPSYPSGSAVVYKCQSYHKIRGTNKVTCLNGAWSALPECLEPCTASSEEMNKNNLKLRWSNEEKLYTEHDQPIEFVCKSNDYIQHEDSPPFRLTCIRGTLLYPRCIRRGSCAPSSKEMDRKNIILMNENTEIKDGNMVEFACKPGFYKKPNQVMRVKCTYGKLDYPECDNTPPVCSRPPSVPHGKVVGDVKNEYNLHSSIEYICDKDYVLKGTKILTCTDWEWSGDVPLCIRLCQVTKDKLEEHFVELSLKLRDKMAFFEGDAITFTCKSGFRVLTPPGILVANCTEAGFNYPTCINPTPCRVSQEGTDSHNLELVGDEVIFHHGAIIQFKCRPGYLEMASLTGTCKNSNIIYPTCLARGSCILEQKELDQKNIKLLPGFANLQYPMNGQIIEFSCKEGYIKHTRSSDLSQVCEEGFIAYPICIRART